jgi:hypothetical protein
LIGSQKYDKIRSFVLVQTGVTSERGYRFSGFSQTVSWPQEDGTQLGMAGTWNLLFRIGACPQKVEENHLHVPEEGDVLYVVAEATFSLQTEKTLLEWMDRGGRIVASGYPEAWQFAFPQNVFLKSAKIVNPYTGLAWLQEGAKPELLAPPNWKYLTIQFENPCPLECKGKLAAISGERQTSSRAHITPIEDAPALLCLEKLIYFNGNPFGALQSWLQGQESLLPWLEWRHRIFWLDEYTAFIYKILKEYRLLNKLEGGIPSLGQTTVIFRHDLDHSRDTTYLDMESQASFPGVYAILKDGNTGFWLDKLRSNPGHESAFHYNTGSYSRILEEIRNKIFKLPKRTYRPDKSAVKEKGLLSQVKWAKKNKIGIETLHRHLAFIVYPELVDALDTVYNNELDVLGSSSFFTGTVLRWGINEVEGMNGTVSDFTDPQFPYWFPFKLAHAGHGGRLLRGWESTSIMEIEPGLVEQMLNYNIPGLPQKVLVFNYHPAHANRPTFVKGGCASWFRDILDLCKSKGVQVRTLSEVYKVLNDHLERTHGK